MSVGCGERIIMEESLMVLIERWGVQEGQKASLLDMGEEEWAKVKAGARISDNSVAWDRAEKLIRIHKMILPLVGGDIDLATDWVGRINMGLGGRSALDIMLSDGGLGVDMVLAYLNRQFI